MSKGTPPDRCARKMRGPVGYGISGGCIHIDQVFRTIDPLGIHQHSDYVEFRAFARTGGVATGEAEQLAEISHPGHMVLRDTSTALFGIAGRMAPERFFYFV